jgi:nucleoside-diphosphate-sugar epimerase
MNMAETILVTGATGTVGSEVVKQLSRDPSNYNIKAGVHSLKMQKMTELRLCKLITTNKKDLKQLSKM